MKIKNIISIILLFFVSFNQLFAQISFSVIFPNTTDDKNLEYIELYNGGNSDVDLNGFTFEDKGGKQYDFGYGDIIESGKSRKYFRPETKITLNNSSEELFLYDNNGDLEDEFYYSTSVKGEKIIVLDLNSGTGETTGTGEVAEEETGTGEIVDDIIIPEKIVWNFQSPSYVLDKDIILDKYICDETKEICKINLDLRDSFTGDIKESGYLCEIDFGFGYTTGEENKCNPNTVELTKGEFEFKFKITSKEDENVFIEKSIFIDNKIIEETTGTGEVIEEEIGTGEVAEEETGTGEIVDDIIIPEKIVWNFQSPSYVLDKDIILDKYICDETKEICKINLDLRDSFTGDIKESGYLCEIDFGFGYTTGEENKCNPNIVELNKGEFEFKFKITSKEDENVFIEKSIFIDNNIDRNIEKNNAGTNTNTTDRTESNNIKENIIINDIIVQSGIKKDVSGKYVCNKEICSVNLLYENDNKNLLCKWDFGGGTFTSEGTDEKCNPGYVKYKKGEYDIKLKLYDKNFNDNYEISNLYFENLGVDFDIDLLGENEEVDITNIIFDLNSIKKIEIGNLSVNPKGSDTLEYIELKNMGSNTVNLKGCFLDDILDGGSKKHIFNYDSFIFPNSSKKYYKAETKLNLNNTGGDEVNLFCGDNKIDSVKWDFVVASGYIVNNKNSSIKSQNVKIIRVVDGDTFVIRFKNGHEEKIRLIGVDTPEVKDPRKPVQYFGLEASKFSKKELFDKNVYLEIDKNNYRDKYSRLLGYIYLDGESFNKKLISEGYARLYDKFDFEYLEDFKKAKEYAKKNKKGMWEKLNPRLEKLLLDEKYNKEIKEDLEYQLLEELIIDKLEVIKKEVKIEDEKNNKYEEFLDKIELLYKNHLNISLDNNFNNIPDEFEEFNIANLIEKNVLINNFFKFNNNELNLNSLTTNVLNNNKSTNNILNNYINRFLKEILGKYKVVNQNLYIIDKEKSIDNYRSFIQGNYKISVSKLQSGLKIYGTSLADSEIEIIIINEKKGIIKNSILNFFKSSKINKIEDNFDKDYTKKYNKLIDNKYILKTDENGNFELIINDFENIEIGDFYIKSIVIDKYKNIFNINKYKIFKIDQEYIYTVKTKKLEKDYKDEKQTLNYLDKNLVNLEKDFDTNLKRIEKENIREYKKQQKLWKKMEKKRLKELKKRLKKEKEKKDKLNKSLYVNKLKKVELIDNKKEEFKKGKLDNGIWYNFIILIFVFILSFILLRKDKNF